MSKKNNQSAGPDINKEWSVTNDSKTSVTAIDAFDPNSTSDSSSLNFIYELPLTYLKTDQSDNQLPSGKVSKVDLDGKNADKSYRELYDVLFALPSTGFPVDDKSVSLPLTSDSYPPYTIPQSDSMSDSYNFLRLIQAFPSSKLAQGFANAVQQQQTDQAKTTPPAANAVDAYFQTTQQYKDCTSVSYAAVLSYNQTFAGASVGFESNYKFYLYQVSGTGSAAAVVEAGTVTFDLNNAKTPFDLSDKNGGYTITFADTKGNDTPLYYSGGQFVSDVKSDLPAICLVVSWISKNQLNGTTTSPDTIIPMMAGYVNGVKVCGTSIKQDTSDGSSTWHWPNTFQGWYSLVLSVFGGIFVLDWLYQKFTAKKKARLEEERRTGERQITDQQNSALNDKIDNLSDQVATANQKILDKLQSEQKFNTDIKAVGDQIKGFDADLAASQQQANAVDQIKELDTQVDALAEYGVTEPLSEAASNLRDAAFDIANAKTSEEVKSALEKWKPELDKVNTVVKERVTELGTEIKEDTKVKIDDAQKNLDDLKEEQEKLEEQERAQEEGDHSEDNEFEGDREAVR